MTTRPSIESLRKDAIAVWRHVGPCMDALDRVLDALDELGRAREAMDGPAHVPISAAGYCMPWEPLVYALDRIVDLGPIHGPGRAAAEARYGRVAAVLEAHPDLADEVERLRLIEAGARDSEALVTRLHGEVAGLRAERDALKFANNGLAAGGIDIAVQLTAANARADALAARCEALRTAVIWMSGSKDFGPGGVAVAVFQANILPLLESTPAADLEAHDARVRREVLEGAAKRALVMLSQSWDPAWGYSDALPGDIQAAILGPAPQPSTENTAPREEETK